MKFIHRFVDWYFTLLDKYGVLEYGHKWNYRHGYGHEIRTCERCNKIELGNFK